MRRRGFTLIELSIVLVIIGLIVGGVLVGRDLVKAAELRAVISEVENIKTAMNTFRLKYGEYPGEFSQAADIFGTGTVSGNNNGVISVLSGDGNYVMGDGDDGPEYLRVWQHLAMANLINGTYTGLPYSTPSYVAGTNMPGTKYSARGGYVLWDNKGVLGSMYIPDAAEYHASMFLMLGGMYTPASTAIEFYAGLLPPMDAWNIDTKTDDGGAYTGATLAYTGTYTNSVTIYPDPTDCSTPITAPGTEAYTLTHNEPACVLLFRLAI